MGLIPIKLSERRWTSRTASCLGVFSQVYQGFYQDTFSNHWPWRICHNQRQNINFRMGTSENGWTTILWWCTCGGIFGGQFILFRILAARGLHLVATQCQIMQCLLRIVCTTSMEFNRGNYNWDEGSEVNARSIDGKKNKSEQHFPLNESMTHSVPYILHVKPHVWWLSPIETPFKAHLPSSVSHAPVSARTDFASPGAHRHFPTPPSLGIRQRIRRLSIQYRCYIYSIYEGFHKWRYPKIDDL